MFGDTARVTASWLEFPFLDLELTGLAQAQLPARLTRLTRRHPCARRTRHPAPLRGQMHYKYMPRTGEWGKADASYAVITPAGGSTARTLEMWRGQGTVKFHRARRRTRNHRDTRALAPGRKPVPFRLRTSAERREAFLTHACASDIDLKREVESLLAGRDGTLLSGGLAGAAARVMPPRGSWEDRTLGTYQLGPMIGAGGMGEVYRARDTRLGRDVAVKILPEALAGSAERLARFEREARILATLNHPNIAAIYGLEESAGVRALVLELVEGVTLAEKLQTDTGAARALPLRDALPIARQMARACEAAHQKGIVHRDLKPANIKIAPDGTVKVLDFGVAKFDAPREPGPTGSGVLSTAEGAVLGTVAYMSPEQARGLPVDRRTDIWAFGCVLYEMLTGCRSFPGDSSADVLGAITSRDPDWTLLPPDTPARVRDVLRRCLAKDAERRYHDMADVRVELDDALDPDGSIAASSSPSPARLGMAYATSVDRGRSHRGRSHHRPLGAAAAGNNRAAWPGSRVDRTAT